MKIRVRLILIFLIIMLAANSYAYTIAATAGSNGSISPAGAVNVAPAAKQTFTMSPKAGYTISDIIIDGNSVGAKWYYIFKNVSADHTVSVKFTPVGPTETVAYSIQHIAGVWMDGILNGPAQASILGAGAISIAFDKHGNIFFAETHTDRVGVITSDGHVWTIAGGIKGYKDGLGDQAEFNFCGEGLYAGAVVLIDADDNIYVQDNLNNRLRKASKQSNGIYLVSTYIGNGSHYCSSVGQNGSISDLKAPFRGPVIDPGNNLWYIDGAGYFVKVNLSTNTYTCFNKAFANFGTADPWSHFVNDAKTDASGNLYYLIGIGGPDAVSYMVSSPSGSPLQLIAGITQSDWNNLGAVNYDPGAHIIDGPTALQSLYRAHGNFSVTADGSTIYGGAGDEGVLRRIKNGQSRSLYTDGWRQETVNRYNGWDVGGSLGIDSEGSIYLFATNPPSFFPIRKMVPRR
jgi:hypothetical protein